MAGYHDKFKRTGAIADLETAIQRFQEALDATPADHPDRAGRLNNLEIEYDDRFKRIGAMTDLETTIQRYQEALDQSSAPVIDRLKTDRILLTLYANAQK